MILTRITNRRKFRFVVWSLTLRRWLRAIQPDVLHAHQVTGAGWLGAGAGYHPFLVTSWGSGPVGERGAARLHGSAWLAWSCAAPITSLASPKALAQEARTLGVGSPRVEVAPWGVDTGVFHPPYDWRSVRAADRAQHSRRLAAMLPSAGDRPQHSGCVGAEAGRPFHHPHL